MDLVIILAGLFLIVEGGLDDPVDILFLQSEGFLDACERPMPKHTMSLKHWTLGPDGQNRAHLKTFPGGSEIRIEIAGRPIEGEVVRLATWENVLKLADLGVNPKVRESCSGIDALEACTADDKPLLIAKLTLRGGSLAPVEYDRRTEIDLTKPQQAAAERSWFFGQITSTQAGSDGSASSPLSKSTSPQKPVRPRRLFNAIVFRTKVDRESPVQIHFGNETLQLEPTQGSLCRTLTDSETCIAGVLRNLPPVDEVAPQVEAVATACEIPGRPEKARCWVDPHFALNYLLLEDSPSPGEALIPYLCLLKIPPWEPAGESRCVPPTGTKS